MFFILPFSFFVFSILAAPVLAQVVRSDGPKPAFEVATVRLNTSGSTSTSSQIAAGGRVTVINATLRSLVRHGWNVQTFQLVGGPGWFDTARFDVIAKVAGADLSPEGRLPREQIALRMQSLLEDRFKLKTHWETRELPVYALVVASGDRTFGPRFKPHTGTCANRLEAPSGTPPENAGCGTEINMSPTSGKIAGKGLTMDAFVRTLSVVAGRSVVNRSGLEGTFDLEFAFTPEQSAETTGPSLFTALQEQLGLKLESQRAPVEVLVIDSAAMPVAD